jgi:bleomycin hydrolase
MKNIIHLFVMLLLIGICQGLLAEDNRQDKATFVKYENEYWKKLEERAEEAKKKEDEEKILKMDFKGVDIPASPEQFNKCWFFSPQAQDLTGTCWSFSSVSFFESEIYRLTKRKIKLSEMYTVYWEYVEKARRFVRERGESRFSVGSQPNATQRLWQMYGIVPAEAYKGMEQGLDFHNDREMFEEMESYLESVKDANAWNKEIVISTIKSIMNHHMGEPPKTVTVEGKTMTPKEYFEDLVRLNMDDYVNVMSLMEKPYFEKVEYEVADNWWHSKDYYNVPLDDFMKIIKKAVHDGYSVCIVGDTSEPGYYPPLDVAVVPTFDILPANIDENARQFRFSNDSTTDDHAIHLVGHIEKNGTDWYLIKDSGSHAQNGKHKGYFFFHKDYVKLKMMNFIVHKDIIEQVLDKKFQ